jgi:hypothetical protein
VSSGAGTAIGLGGGFVGGMIGYALFDHVQYGNYTGREHLIDYLDNLESN